MEWKSAYWTGFQIWLQTLWHASWMSWPGSDGRSIVKWRCVTRGLCHKKDPASSLLSRSQIMCFRELEVMLCRHSSSLVGRPTRRGTEASRQQAAPTCQPGEWPPWKWIRQPQSSLKWLQPQMTCDWASGKHLCQNCPAKWILNY